MKYGWVCKNCGAWRHSDERVIVDEFRRDHRKLGCVLIEGGDGVKRRPDLHEGGQRAEGLFNKLIKRMRWT